MTNIWIADVSRETAAFFTMLQIATQGPASWTVLLISVLKVRADCLPHSHKSRTVSVTPSGRFYRVYAFNIAVSDVTDGA